MTITSRVRRAIKHEGLLTPGARVVVALSGGSDSVALCLLLRELSAVLAFSVVGAAHLNHALRGAESDADEQFCREFAASLDLPLVVDRQDVGIRARAHRVSVEVAARRERYRFLERAAGRLDADVIATGHTADDQAETFLLRLLRGAGATALAGIPWRRDTIIRPILGERRADLRAYLQARGATYREDSSNTDVSVPRNWVRHVLLPRLAGELRGDVVGVLVREAGLLRADGALLDDLATEAAGRLLLDRGVGRVQFEREALLSLPPALARRVIRHALARVSPAFQGTIHVERVWDAAAGTGADTVDLPGVRVERNSQNVVLCSREGRGRRAAPVFSQPLPVPGRVVVPEAGITIEAGCEDARSRQVPHIHAVAGEWAGHVDADAIVDGLWVRSRRPGDTFRPLGLGGRKKLQDVFVDKKVPRGERDRVPLVVDGRNRILWVAGVGPSDEARVTESTQSVVTFTVNRLGELG